MVKIIAKAHFPGMKPAHHADIAKQGEGSSWAVAACDALRKIAKDDRLKGKRASNILPGRITFNVFTPSSEDGE
jgi:hypothetical protein